MPFVRAAALLLVPLVIATVEPAFASPPARVAPVACGVKGSPLWRTSFHGEKTDFWGRKWSTHDSPCFRSEKACKAWLYWAQTDWPDMNGFTPCKRIR